MSYKDILRRRSQKSTEGRVIWKLSPYQIIGKPLITEKAYKLVEDMNTYTFRVHNDANKNDVKESLGKLYDVIPTSIRVVRVVDKWRLNRKLVRRWYKKMYVALKKWDKIDLAG